MSEALMKFLSGGGEPVEIPRDEFVKEHKHLVKLLSKTKDPALKKERRDQAKELAGVLKGGDLKSWRAALKEWNEGQTKWSIPRKGTPEYNEVIAIMGRPKGILKKERKGVLKKTEPVEFVKVESKMREKVSDEHRDEMMTKRRELLKLYSNLHVPEFLPEKLQDDLRANIMAMIVFASDVYFFQGDEAYEEYVAMLDDRIYEIEEVKDTDTAKLLNTALKKMIDSNGAKRNYFLKDYVREEDEEPEEEPKKVVKKKILKKLPKEAPAPAPVPVEEPKKVVKKKILKKLPKEAPAPAPVPVEEPKKVVKKKILKKAPKAAPAAASGEILDVLRKKVDAVKIPAIVPEKSKETLMPVIREAIMFAAQVFAQQGPEAYDMYLMLLDGDIQLIESMKDLRELKYYYAKLVNLVKTNETRYGAAPVPAPAPAPAKEGPPMVITRRKGVHVEEIAKLSEQVKAIERAVAKIVKADPKYKLPKADAAVLKQQKKQLRELRARS